MRAELINPFLKATLSTFQTMVNTSPSPSTPYVKAEPGLAHDVSGIIGLSGGAKGAVIISFPTRTALATVSAFIGLNVSQIDADVTDAVGELANIIAGAAKADLAGLNVTISLPSVVVGQNHKVTTPKDIPSIVIPFNCTHGDFIVEVCIALTESK
jgi:chemotaxis protein CheX